MTMRAALLPLLAGTMLVLVGCQSAPKKDLALERVKTSLEQLKSDEELTGYAPLAVGEAERALRRAEQATQPLQREHLIYMAEKKIAIARAIAQREQLEVTFNELEEERDGMRIRASELETAQARKEAEQARLMMAASEEDAERRRREAEAARQQEQSAARDAELAREEAEQARRLADSRASEAELARREAELAVAQIDSLKRQLENLQLRETESGVVVTLGDVLFNTGETVLREEAMTSLVEVVDLLQTEPDKSIRIEGHTDSTGPAETNLRISQERADAVMAALVSLGVDAPRMKAVGMGEDFPIASNETEEGRTSNRRVDVILLDSDAEP
jgi:outer membrane protein OmpA-like peptidoglycan-associated protein